MLQAGKGLIVIGAICIAVGLLLLGAQKLGLGRLPGDFSWKGKNGSFHFPLATSLLVSVVLTVLVNLWLRRSR
jgi:ribose/xylose/arabinose/galactoside ABC-type transport system permease subunit